MVSVKPIEVRCPRCGAFKAELTRVGAGGRYACCGVSWEMYLVAMKERAA